MGRCREIILLALLLVGCSPVSLPFLPTPTPLPVTIDSLRFDSAYLTNTPRKVDVFLPPGYAQSTETYPVLYAQDGQDMQSVRLKETLEILFAQNAIQPIIVVAIHASGERLSEYGTAGIPDYQFRGSRADLYTRMLLEEIMPEIEARYRVKTGPQHTSVMGWSLGGLMAFDLAWNHPGVFGRVGVFSGSFWWHTDNTDLDSMLNSRIAHNMVREGPLREGMRFWFESGFLDEEEDRDGDGVIDSVQDTRELVAELKALGYADGNIRLLELEQGYHSPGTWAEALPDFLLWAFPVK